MIGTPAHTTRVRRPALLAALAVLALALLMAFAARPAAASSPGGQLHVVATGAASADLQGKIVVIGALPQATRVEVRGKQGAFRLTLDGVAQRSKRGVVRVAAATGRLFLQSNGPVRIRLVGPDFDLSVAGRGIANLSGAGTFSLNGTPDAPWTGTPILIQATPAAKRKPTPPPPPPDDGSGTTTGTTTTTRR